MPASTDQFSLFCSTDADAPPASRRRARAARQSELRLCVLGSGSGGNATILRHGQRGMLIDAGFGPRTTGKRLAQAQLTLDQIQAICLTHLDRDHCRPTWPAAALQQRITVYLHHWHLPELHRLPAGPELFEAGLVEPFDHQPFEPLPGLDVAPIRLQHDTEGTIGFRLTGRRAAVGYATDLGHVPPALVRHFAGVDLLCLEANYDPDITARSSRPAFVNRRNMSSSGHLSNEQAFAAAQKIAQASAPGRPEQIVLLHRSRQCNHPTTVRRTFERDPELAARIHLTDQRRRSRWFQAKPLPAVQQHQMGLGFG